jgi:hypothetical protein
MTTTSVTTLIVTWVSLWLLYRIFTKRWNPLSVIIGADGRPSTSKFQFFLWTLVILSAYVALYAARVALGLYQPIEDFPQHLLVAMGLSVSTLAAAKAIAEGYNNSGKSGSTPLNPAAGGTNLAPASPQGQPNPGANISAPQPKPSGIGYLLTDDDGNPDLSKMQMVAWTVVAIGVFVILLIHHLQLLQMNVGKDFFNAVIAYLEDPTQAKPTPGQIEYVQRLISLPDIPGSLMVLMGLGQGAYLGKKLVTINTPRLTGLSPSAGKPSVDVTLSGVAFGSAQNGSIITINGNPGIVTVKNWSDTQILFSLPATQADGTPWQAGQQIQVGLIVNGQVSANTLPFTILSQ